jgi:hypothetical protein
LVVHSVAFSPDGQTLASGSHDKTVRLWDLGTGQPKATLTGHTDRVLSVAFSPDGQRVFGWDVTNKVLAWTVADAQPANPDQPRPVTSKTVVTSPDGSTRAEVRSYGLVLIDVARERQDREERLALEPVNRRWWHQQNAARAEGDQNWFAAAFHLGQLLKEQPNDADLKRRREQALDKLRPPTPMEPLPRP